MNNPSLPARWPAPGHLSEGRAFVLKEDVIFTPLGQEGSLCWLNARLPSSGGSFIIATGVSDEEEASATRLLRNEFALREYLNDDWAIRPVASTQYHGRFALVYAPFSFVLLTRIVGAPLACIPSFLELAIRISLPLRLMHLRNLVHGDIKPGNIFIHDDNSCRLGGFGLSSGTPEALQTMPLVGGTPAYMSPEHTTRTHRSVDNRSDLYSLGVVFYELLTGSLPFELGGEDQGKWAHYHIASEPRAPGAVCPGVPAMLSAIVLKLLAKKPEHRYQTVDGLIADLRRCQATLSDEGDIAAFTPGLQDRSPAFHLTDTLYTAHPQAGELLHAFDRVSRDALAGLVAISGPSGIGKSSLIASGLKALQQRHALLAVSKVDQFSPTLPYAALTSAFRSLVLHLLGLPAQQVAQWKVRLSRELEGYEALAVSLVPELRLLLDSKPRFASDTFAIDARARFSHMMLVLVNTLASAGCPLVLLLDDIHWADAASLQILEYLLINVSNVPLLMVVAYRDASSLPDNALQQQLASLHRASRNTTELRPEALSVKAVSRWLANIFHTRSASTADLAELIHQKTGGNPLFVHEFFRRIVDDGLVTHNKYQDKWCYDLHAIRTRHYTENVVTLVLQQLEEMPEETRRLLGSIACLGGSGELEMVCRVMGMSVAEIRYALHPAVTAQLITLSADGYAFTHDRVQEAAFALLDSAEKSRLHLTTASLLAESARQAAGNEILFRAVHHVTAALDCIQPAPQRQMFRELSLLAARRARRSGDYPSALSYIQTARALGDAGLATDVTNDFTLDSEEAGCEFALGNLESTRRLCDRILGSPGGLAEKALAANLLAEVYLRQSDNRLALEATLSWLAVFGIHVTRHPQVAECDEAWQSLCNRVGDNPQGHFTRLTRMTNTEIEAVMNLLNSASLFASFTHSRLHFILLCRMMHLTLDHGITGASTSAMAWFGVLIGHRYAEYRLGFQYGTLARELVNRHGYDAFEAKTLLPLDQLSVWTQPLGYTIECAKACFTSAVTHGDMTVACFAVCHQVINFLTRGDHLDGVLTSIERGLAFVRKTHFQNVEAILLIQRHYVEHLRTPVSGRWSASTVLPESLLPEATEQASEQLSTLQFWFWLYRGMAHFACGEYPQAAGNLEQAGRFAWSAPGHIHQLDYHLYSALALSQQLTPETFSADLRRQIHLHYDKIALWARINPGIFADKEALIYAEIVRLDGMNSIALEQYEKAVRLSREGGFNPFNALAHELAGRFAHACGYTTAADAHFRGAMTAWGRSGAQSKVRQLERDFPYLLAPGQANAWDTVAFARNEEIRDLQSVIKASRALSEEINLERLIETLMTILLERAGAQRGLLIRVSDNNIPEIEASASTTTDGVQVQIMKEVPMATDLPLTVLAAVIRTGQEIHTGKPEAFHPFSQDPYLVTSGAAVMCVPMFKQARLVGVLYLENRLMPEVFTQEHSRVVSLLGAHAAISLETARLYAELLEENLQRRRVEKELRASQTSLMLGEQISHTGSWRWELQQDLMFMSEEYARILGLPEQQKMISMAEFLTFVHQDDYPRISTLVTESVRDGLTMRAEFRIIRADGATRTILGIGDPVGVGREVNEYYGIITDITTQRMAEDAMRVAQAELARVSRATTVGQLTSSIAHEINQPLMSIVANAGASLRWLNRDPARLDKVQIGLEEIVSEGERAGEIIRSLQSLTRKQDPAFTRIDLHALVRHIITLSRSELEQRRISVTWALAATDSFIVGDSVQIQQVLLNLVMNAVEAMAEIKDRPGTLLLSTSNPGSGGIAFEIADSGTGIEPGLTERIFDSFYSTKAQGMGVGLTISYSIIERHRGKLTARNRAPHGSVFAFTLPLAASVASL
ncbi:trifunctional serine/threonine-protein kinase/ATP-binding protein/sensor histidine kinase [Silvania hatchlandensis]|uniref:histidine kinase n=1 Tax=Silvania hatchlandensis TaxID=2926469 RepID=A0A9J6Q806_9ENTR|nr:ATP-binding sensor histidine kinase [Silvania hatchlandensis]MCU6665638.1 AAA family ATPase [Silvania hatchlandensis]